MIETLISSKTRIKLLLKFFLNSNNSAYLRKLEEEFQESTNSIRIELNRLEKAKMLVSKLTGNKKLYQANTTHPLFLDVKNIVLKHTGIDKIISNVIENLGDVQSIYLVGTMANGIDSEEIQLIFIGQINEQYLQKIITKSEKMINKKISYLVQDTDSLIFIENTDCMLLWQSV
jgi:predicted transcriptional regulator